MNQFNTITTKKKIVQITIRQSEHQTITVTCNGVSHTESFSVYSNTPYTIKVQPEMWYSPGELNIPKEGVFETDTIITVTDASIRTDYTLYEFSPVEIPDNYMPPDGHQWFGCVGANIDWRDRFPERDGDGILGLVDGYYIFDMLGYYPPKHTPVFCFWGSESVKGLFKTMDLSVTTPDGVTHEIIKKYPNEYFGPSGDIAPWSPYCPNIESGGVDYDGNGVPDYTGEYTEWSLMDTVGDKWKDYINEELWEQILNENIGKNLQIIIHIDL